MASHNSLERSIRRGLLLATAFSCSLEIGQRYTKARSQLVPAHELAYTSSNGSQAVGRKTRQYSSSILPTANDLCRTLFGEKGIEMNVQHAGKNYAVAAFRCDSPGLFLPTSPDAFQEPFPYHEQRTRDHEQQTPERRPNVQQSIRPNQ